MQKENLRIVFMGTPEFAVSSLDALVKQGFQVVGVVTTADKKAGRGKKLQMAAVKKYALEHEIPVLTPLNLKDPDFLDALKALRADVQVVVAFRMLPKVVWDAPPLGTFNLHASLLPQYRGAAPINHVLINGDTETGVTTFFLDEKIDTGRIIMQRKCNISEDETAGHLHDRLMSLGAELVVETVEKIASGEVELIEQKKIESNRPLQKAPKIFKDDCKINWEQSAISIYNKIRGLSPYPAAWTMLIGFSNQKEVSVKIYLTKKTNMKSDKTPGMLMSDGKTYLRVATLDFDLEITELQLQGKKRLPISDFLRGFSFIEGMSFQ